MLGCFNPNLGKIWTSPNVGLKMSLKKIQLKVKVEVGLTLKMTFLTQHLGLSIFDPNLGWNNPVLFRVHNLYLLCFPFAHCDPPFTYVHSLLYYLRKSGLFYWYTVFMRSRITKTTKGWQNIGNMVLCVRT